MIATGDRIVIQNVTIYFLGFVTDDKLLRNIFHWRIHKLYQIVYVQNYCDLVNVHVVRGR